MSATDRIVGGFEGSSLPVDVQEAIALLELWSGTMIAEERMSDGGAAARLRLAISHEQREAARVRLEEAIAAAIADASRCR